MDRGIPRRAGALPALSSTVDTSTFARHILQKASTWQP